jgi:hypothetical protein
MKLKVPFLNFKNYVVLKCYTDNGMVHSAFPVKLGIEYGRIKTRKDVLYGFRTCTGRTATLKRSATLPTWVTYDVYTKDGTATIYHSDAQPEMVKADWDLNEDAYLGADKLDKMLILKLDSPWWFEEDTGVNFVYAANVHNTTRWHTPSGILNFKYQHAVNLFNYIHVATDHHYSVVAGTPAISYYPLTDKKFYVESIYDVAKTKYLKDKCVTRPFWGNHAVRVKNALCSHAK